MIDLRVSLDRIARLVSVSIVVVNLWGCGGGASTTSAPTPVAPTPTSSNATLQGQWQIVAHSNVNPASSILVEANFTQSGSTVTADTSSVVLIEGVPGAFTGSQGNATTARLGMTRPTRRSRDRRCHSLSPKWGLSEPAHRRAAAEQIAPL
jgi:hypothetical protein